MTNLCAIRARVHRDRAAYCAGDAAERFKTHQAHVDAFTGEDGERSARGASYGGVHEQWRRERRVDADDHAGVSGVGRDYA